MDQHDVNRAMWDERVPIHLDSEFYDLAGFRAGTDTLRDFEVAELGEVAGRRVAHLQCHLGLDTLSLARRGAEVTGLDFSEPAVEAARDLAAELALPARFVAANVYDAVEALGGETFDLVYTGIGALCWLPDLDRWAATVAALLRTGGALYLAEFHPFTDLLDNDTGGTVVADYFRDEPDVYDSSGSYADWNAATSQNRVVEWHHRLGTVLTALSRAGLRLDFLHEHDVTLFPRFANLVRGPGGTYRRPAGVPRIPLMYSLRATR
jgi:SAM-dependent methyltransferase